MDTKTIALIVMMVILGIFWIGPMYLAVRAGDQLRKKRGELPPKAFYDERQTIIRLRAGIHALFALVGYLILWAALDLIGGQKGGWAWTGEVVPLAFGGVILAVEVWTVECTLRDAAVGWNQKNGAAAPRGMYPVYAAYLAIFGISFLINGNAVMGCVMSLSAAGLLVVIVVTVYAVRRRKKQPDQEDE